MRRLIRLVVHLYPRQWRRRYGSEFEALLDEVGFGWRTFVNILLGALIMQMKTPGGTAILLMLIAALAGGVASLSIPARPSTSAGRGNTIEPARVQYAQSREVSSVNQMTWHRFETAHFSLVFRPDNASRMSAVGSLAERAYAQVRSDLLHDLSLKPLLVIFNTRGDVEQALADAVVRLDVPRGDGPSILLWYDDPSLPGTLLHEVTHAFILDIIPPFGREDVPVWIHEGLADHERGDWREPDVAFLRDMVRANAVPAMTAPFSGDRRLHRILGHATFDFIVSRVGKDGLRRFLAALRNDPTSNLVGVYREAFGPAFDDFDGGFAQYLRARFPEQPQA